MLSNILLPLFIPEPEYGTSIVRTLSHSHVSQLDGNLANPSQKRSFRSLMGHMVAYDDAKTADGAASAVRHSDVAAGPRLDGQGLKGIYYP